MELIIDDREKSIIPFITQYHNDHEEHLIPYVVKRLEVGDYAVAYRGRILFIVERKTWVDLSASMRDGRKDNVNKLLNVRAETGCCLMYIIEGPAFIKPDRLISRIPFKNLKAHLDHLMFRDHIHIQHTADQEHTACRLFELARNYSTVKNPSLLAAIDQSLNTTGGVETQLLTTRQARQISEQEQLLQCLPSIGSVVTVVLCENGVSFASLYRATHTEAELAQIKYADGRKVGLVRAKKILNNIRVLRGKSQLAYSVSLKLLASINGVSRATAVKILSAYTVEQLMTCVTIDELSTIERNKTTIGKKVAGRVINTLQNIEHEEPRDEQPERYTLDSDDESEI